MATTKKPSAAQVAARKLFAMRAKTGAFKQKAAAARKKNPPKVRTRKQDLAIAMSEQRAGHSRKAKEFFKAAARAKNPSKHGANSEFIYTVEVDSPMTGSWQLIAGFNDHTEAVKWAKGYANRVMLKVRVFDNLGGRAT